MIKKRHIKGEKHIAPMDFAEHLRKSEVSENSKVYYMVDFYEMDFMEGIGSKVDEMYNILKPASHYLLVERRWNWMIKVFAGVCP